MSDILSRLTAAFERLLVRGGQPYLPQPAAETKDSVIAIPDLPRHAAYGDGSSLSVNLRPMTREIVDNLIASIRNGVKPMPIGLELELMGWSESCAPHDARRVANFLEHIARRADLADLVFDAAGDA